MNRSAVIKHNHNGGVVTMLITRYDTIDMDELLHLYATVGWTNYTDHPDMLKAALEHSLNVLAAYDGDTLVGIIRVVGDGHSIILIQDILVLPEYRRQKVGTVLMHAILSLYADVYQILLLTDNREETTAFYRSLGFVSVDEIGCLAYVKR